MEFEWDPLKADANEAKHGVSFLDATDVFGDPLSSTVADPDHSQSEDRFIIFGISKDGKYLVVSYTANDRIRIISARTMTARERQAYEQ